MKITEKDAKSIIKKYALGNIKSVKLLQGGLSNFNFEIHTENGKFIARFSSFKPNKKQLDRLKLQIDAIKFLSENNFCYEVPFPVMGNNGKYVNYLQKKPYWIYKKIEGEIYTELSKVDLSQLAKLMAEYHKAIERMPLKKKLSTFHDYLVLQKNIIKVKKQLAKKKTKDKLDILMSSNIKTLEQGLNRIAKINFGNERIVAHSDWFVSNLVHRDGKIIGLIDFDLFELAPRIKDIACAIQLYCFTKDNKWDKEAARNFVDEYEKIARLDKFDKYHLKDLIIRESLFASIFFYDKNKKASIDKKHFLLRWSLDSIRNLLEDIEKEDYF